MTTTIWMETLDRIRKWDKKELNTLFSVAHIFKRERERVETHNLFVLHRILQTQKLCKMRRSWWMRKWKLELLNEDRLYFVNIYLDL